MFSKFFSETGHLFIGVAIVAAFIFVYPRYLDWVFFHKQDAKNKLFFEMIDRQIADENATTIPDSIYRRGDTIVLLFKNTVVIPRDAIFLKDTVILKNIVFREPDSTYCTNDTLVSIYKDMKGNMEKITKSKI